MMTTEPESSNELYDWRTRHNISLARTIAAAVWKGDNLFGPHALDNLTTGELVDFLRFFNECSSPTLVNQVKVLLEAGHPERKDLPIHRDKRSTLLTLIYKHHQTVVESLGEQDQWAFTVIYSLTTYPFNFSDDQTRTLATFVAKMRGSFPSDYPVFDKLFPNWDASPANHRLQALCVPDDLAWYIVTHPQHVDAVRSIILQRSIVDVENISAIIDSSATPSLANGAL